MRETLRTMAEDVNGLAGRMKLKLRCRDADNEVIDTLCFRDGDDRACDAFDRAVEALDGDCGEKRKAERTRLPRGDAFLQRRRRGRTQHTYMRVIARAVRAMTIVGVILSGNGNVQALADSSPSSGTLSAVHFADYTPLSSNMELARRMLSPLQAAELPKALAQKGERLSEQPIDLAQESFALYVPAREPPQGYGLVVFVLPWDTARLPDGWGPVLDEKGLIFVSAARSGNDQSALGRREPLAVLAEQNVAHRYRIDPQRIYVAGFSGGSRVALRLALAYPDLFRGAILNASSDPIGTAAVQLPPKDLLLQFQEMAHLVYVTGDRDTARVGWDFASMHSLRDWCVFNVEYQTNNFTGHEVMNPDALSRALDSLAKPIKADPGGLAECRARIDAELESRLRQVQSLISAGNRDAARHILQDIDTRFGGLAAPQTLELESELDQPVVKP
jgi:predicted esterase